MHPVAYLKDTWSELRRVTWPTRAETLKLTAIVIALSLFVGLYVGSLDLLFTNILKLVFK